MYFLSYLRTLCLISYTLGVNLGTYGENLPTFFEINCKVWFNPLLNHLCKCHEICVFLRIFCLKNCGCGVYLTNIMYVSWLYLHLFPCEYLCTLYIKTNGQAGVFVDSRWHIVTRSVLPHCNPVAAVAGIQQTLWALNQLYWPLSA